jgi:excisionase family DNA binding protein
VAIALFHRVANPSEPQDCKAALHASWRRALNAAEPLQLIREHRPPSAPANTLVAQESVGLEADDRLAYSVNEAAQRLGVGPMTLYREIAEGKLPAIRIRDRVLVPKVVLERLVLRSLSAV